MKKIPLSDDIFKIYDWQKPICISRTTLDGFRVLVSLNSEGLGGIQCWECLTKWDIVDNEVVRECKCRRYYTKKNELGVYNHK